MKRGDRFARALVVLVVASTFGPYLTAGVRTDQVVIYGVAVVLMLSAPWMWLRLRPTRTATHLAAAWVLYAAVGIIGALGVPRVSAYASGSLLAGMDNLLLPVALMALIWLLVTPERRERLLGTACRTVVWLTAANGVLAVVSTRVDLSRALRPFWGADVADGLTVSERAAQLGRLSGVFNQPAEAGLMYGLAGLAAVYVYRERQRLMYLLLVPIFIGGALSVSKVFLLVGAPLVVWQVLRSARSRIMLALAAATAVVAVAQTRLLADWSGAAYLQRLIRPANNVGYIDYYTAGRLGHTSTLATVASDAWQHARWWGFGARGVQAPYDNGWVEALVMAGVAGVICYSAVLLVLLALPRTLAGPDRRLAWGVGLLACGASVGLPALTANRSGAVLWVLVALLCVRRTVRQADGSSTMLPATTMSDGPRRVASAGTPNVQLATTP